MKNLRQLINNRYVRSVIIILIIVATFGIFGYYLATHHEVLQSVISLDPGTIMLLTFAYLGTVAANAFVLWVSLRLIKKQVKFSENIVLTGYSSVVNFFGPLQSGPGFRAAYLKKRHDVSLKKFFYVTLVFYAFFAVINSLVIAFALFFTQQNKSFFLAALGLAAIVGVIGWLAIKKNKRLSQVVQMVQLTNVNFWLIGLGALLLSIATTLVYFIELTHVDPSVTIAQTLIYTAAANLALFVSLTPGAIGFRESFILLAQQLHDISSNTIISASIIDRAFYVVFLLALFVILLVSGFRSKIRKAT